MNKISKRLGLFAITGVLVASSVSAVRGDAGSSQDPLVTKSYVDSQIAELKLGGTGNTSVLEERLTLQEQLIDILKQQIQTLEEEVTSLQSENKAGFEVVTVPKGQTILGLDGSEMIIRAGKATVVGSIAGGLQDMTDGKDLFDQSDAPKYHLMIIPRADGRGLYAQTDLVMMVRGGYTIQ